MLNKKLNINTGENYKVTNRKTKVVHKMNAQELANFVFKNDATKYDIETLKNRFIDKVPFFVLLAALVVLSMLSTLAYIQLNY